MAGYALHICNLLKQKMEQSPLFPYDHSVKRSLKKDKPHMLDAALKANVVIPLGKDTYYFEIGNENAEAKAPQYHILEDAKIIRRPNKATKKSKGSQANIFPIEKRDYGAMLWRKRTQSKGSEFGKMELIQEYRQNQTRNFWGDADKAREYVERVKYHNKNNRNYYENKHYKYIERILDVIVPQVAQEIGAKLAKTTSGLGDVDVLDNKLYRYVDKAKSVFQDLMTGEVLGL